MSNHKQNPRYVPLDIIDMDGSTQSRAAIRHDTVEEYAKHIRDQVSYPFPPITLFFDGERHYIADGWHRVLACQKAENPSVLADVRNGSRRDAVLHALGANREHGIRRTNEDKRRALSIIFADPEWSKNSNRWIAETVGVDEKTVRMHRGDAPTNRTGKDGVIKSYRKRENADSRILDNEEADGPPNEFDAPPGPETIDPDNFIESELVEEEDPLEEKPRHLPIEERVARGVERTRFTDEVKAMYRYFRDGKELLEKIAKQEPNGRYFRAAQPRIEQLVNTISDKIKANTPAQDCKKCKGHGCKGCKMTGYVTELQASAPF